MPTYETLKRPTIFAHRGSSAHAPENTLAAFKLAIEQGAEAIELDVKLSSDGEVVLMHDDTVDRTTNGTGRVCDQALVDLKKLDAGIKFNPSYQGEPIPTLAEVFDAFGNRVFINMELTNYSTPADDLTGKVLSLVKEHGLESSVMLSSKSILNLAQVHARLPAMPLGFITHAYSAHELLQSNFIRLGPHLALHPHLVDSTIDLIEAAHALDSRVHVFTVNFANFMEHLFKSGVDGIFTDDPPLALKVLSDMNGRT